MKRRLFIELLSIESGKSYGFQEFSFNLLDYLSKHIEDFLVDEVHLIIKNEEIELFETYSSRFNIVGYSYKNILQRYYIQNMLPIWMKMSKNDVILTPDNYSGLFKKCHSVITIHDLLFKRVEWLPKPLMRYQRELYIPVSIKHADKIIAISSFTAQDIEYYYPKISKGKVSVIRNYFNFNKYESKPINTIGNYILAVSSNEYHKNLVTLIKAYAEYCEMGGPLDFYLVGKLSDDSVAGKEYSLLTESIKKRIHFNVNITNDQLGKLYQNAAFYVSASLFEGLGMPIVEAMYFNLPVLISDDMVFREVSLGMGEYFNPLDSHELAYKMIKLDFSKRDYSEKIIEAYSEKHTSAKYIDVINSVLGGAICELWPNCAVEGLTA